MPQPHVYVLLQENPYDTDVVIGVYTSKLKAEQYVQYYVNNNDGRGGDDFKVVQYVLDIP